MMTAERDSLGSLPREAYFDPQWFAAEQEAIFGRTWAFAGMTDDYPSPGSYRAVPAGPNPLLVIRDGERSYRCFHNVCRHRGARVLAGAGKIRKSIVCPYHRWCYDLDGRLTHVPQADEFEAAELDRAALGLHEGRADTFRGMVFVHPEPDAEPLESWLSEFPEHFGPFDPEAMEEVAVADYEFACNWKTYVENHQDGYHLGYVHRTTLAGYDHSRQEHHNYRGHWSFYEPIRDAIATPPDLAETRMPEIGGLSRRWQGSNVHVLFPNLAISTGASFWCSLEIIPLAPERCQLRLRVRGVAPPASPSVRSRAAQVAQRAPAAISALRGSSRAPSASALRQAAQILVHGPPAPLGVLAEDEYCCEAIQSGLHSTRFQVGPIAPRLEAPVLNFQRAVLELLAENGGGPEASR